MAYQIALRNDKLVNQCDDSKLAMVYPPSGSGHGRSHSATQLIQHTNLTVSKDSSSSSSHSRSHSDATARTAGNSAVSVAELRQNFTVSKDENSGPTKPNTATSRRAPLATNEDI